MAKIHKSIRFPAFAVLATAALLASPLRAQAPPPPIPIPAAAPQVPAAALPAAPETAASAEAPPVVIPEGLTPDKRDPFWPVGYRPKSAEELAQEKMRSEMLRKNIAPPKWDEARAGLRIGGYMKTPGGYTSLVNNALVNAGDVVALLFEGKQYRWKVETISARGISLAQLDWVQVDNVTQNSGKGQP